MRQVVISILIVMGILSLVLAGCSTTTGAAKVMEDYLNALVAKDADRVVALSCAAWEPNARMEVDSFQAVEIRIEGLDCQESGSEGITILVTCQGKIIATYNNEDQEIDLSARTYQINREGSEYLVCGYK